MGSGMRIQLSFMMFLEFFIWGAWFVTMGTFLSKGLGALDTEIGMAYETQSWGAIIAPFIIGLIADRFFDAKIILGIIHLMGAGLLYMASQSPGFAEFYPYVLGYMLVYMPTLALVNAIAFNQMEDPSAQFPSIRVWGTVGWIAAGLMIGYMGWESANLLQNTFLLAAGASLVLGLLSFTLPKTPPKSKGESVSLRDILGLDALGMLKDRNYLVFFIASILICIPLAFYYGNANLYLNESGVDNAAAVMTLGQASEVLFMLLLPLFLKKYGIKMTLFIGMLAWVARYLLFAYGDGATGTGYGMLVGAIVLHGICYDFFFVSGQIYTDYKAGEKFKSAAQGLITLATYGLGMLIGFRVGGMIVQQNAIAGGGHAWEMVWIIPACIAGAVGLLYFITFKNEKIELE